MHNGKFLLADLLIFASATAFFVAAVASREAHQRVCSLVN
jgi:hypothetical protein